MYETSMWRKYDGYVGPIRPRLSLLLYHFGYGMVFDGTKTAVLVGI